MNDDHPRAGMLFLVGLGPGSPGLLPPDAVAALEAADTVVGYRGYLDLLADRLTGKTVISRDLGQEVERADTALHLAEEGHVVALISSGDIGVYGMGGVAWELAAERQTKAEIVVVPGITAACSAAARLGAPLAHDWACISLSDLLTPWEVILQRVDAAARADFVLVFYNPASRTRTRQLTAVADRLLSHRGTGTPVGLVENAFRPGERVEVVSLLDLALGKPKVSMFTTVVVGSSRTFVADGKMITPRIYAAKSAREAGASGRGLEPENLAPGDRIMAESLAIIDRELGPHPSDPSERAVARRVIHASADFEFATALRFAPGVIETVVESLRSESQHGRIPVVTDVEMLRAGIRKDLAEPLNVLPVCFLNDPETDVMAASEGITRSAAGMRRAVEKVGGRAIYAVGNAPTALEEVLRLARENEAFVPLCVIGIPVGFVGVEPAKQRLLESDMAFITSLGRKGGTAVTAAVVNALLELAQPRRIVGG